MTGSDHEHGSVRAGEHGGTRYKRRLLLSLAIVGAYSVVEVVGGLLTNSLALLSDAGHMLTDVIGLGMAAAAIHAVGRARRDARHTFGLYRLEILAALANAALLFSVALYIVYEAWQRFSDPPEVMSLPMLLIAFVGLLVNVGVLLLLRKGAVESINVEGAYLEVLADLFGSIGVIVAAVVMQATAFRLVDPIFGVAIGVMALPRTWRLGRKAVRILLEAATPSMDLDAIQSALEGIEGVVAVHDLHVWTLTSGMEVGSVHLRVADDSRFADVLKEARTILRERFHIDHPTVQIEPASGSCEPCTARGNSGDETEQ
ncbi:MAG: cation transporter [Myxococcales bacterium]|nr:cation transporter [Myxococcales bacterium]